MRAVSITDIVLAGKVVVDARFEVMDDIPDTGDTKNALGGFVKPE